MMLNWLEGVASGQSFDDDLGKEYELNIQCE